MADKANASARRPRYPRASHTTKITARNAIVATTIHNGFRAAPSSSD
jgi:hypothetical protein